MVTLVGLVPPDLSQMAATTGGDLLSETDYAAIPSTLSIK